MWPLSSNVRVLHWESPSVARGTISLPGGFHYCHNLFILPDQRVCIVKNMYRPTCINISDCVETVRELPLLPVKHFNTNREGCEVFTGFYVHVNVHRVSKVEESTNKRSQKPKLIHFHKLNMFRAPLCPSSGVQDYMVFCTCCSVRCCYKPGHWPCSLTEGCCNNWPCSLFEGCCNNWPCSLSEGCCNNWPCSLFEGCFATTFR
jgi:hypothetical protein